MAPPIVHFLVGAAVVLVVASPLAMTRELHPSVPLWLVLIGGIWGLFPDVHNISPIYVEELRRFHHSPWADLFGFHYTLDRSYVRQRFYPSILGAIGVFLGAITLFTVASSARPIGVPREVTATIAVFAGLVLLLVIGSPFIGGMAELIAVIAN